MSPRLLGAVAMALSLFVAGCGLHPRPSSSAPPAPSSPLPPAASASPEALPAMQTVQYCNPGGTPLAMDIWAPAAGSKRPAPVALHVHGGGWTGGNRRGGGYLTDLQPVLSGRGFLVASIDYRLAPANPWPDQIDDVRCAVSYLRSHAGQLGIDPQRIGVWGESAGGHLVSLLGTDPGSAGPVQAVADLFGPSDLTASGYSPGVEGILNRVFGPSPDVRAQASPVTHVAAGDPAFLILQGDQDTTVPASQSQELAQRLQAAGVPVQLVMVKGGRHGLAGAGMDPAQAQLESDVADFLTRQLLG